MKTINILGIPFVVEEVPVIDEEKEGVTVGITIHSQAKILLKQGTPKDLKESVLYHEVLHAILELLGYSELTCDETFVQGLSNAIYQMFELRR